MTDTTGILALMGLSLAIGFMLGYMAGWLNRGLR